LSNRLNLSVRSRKKPI